MSADINAYLRDIEICDPETAKRLNELDVLIEEDESVFFDISNAFNLDSIEERAAHYYFKHSSSLRWMELTRNVLILIPIVITWLELALATSAYRKAIIRAPDLLDKPFILLWEEGFNVNHHLTFSELAYVDFALLVIIVLLSAWIHYHRDVSESKAYEKARSLRFHLEAKLWQARQQLSGSGEVQDLSSSVALLTTAADRFHKSAGGVLSSITHELARLDSVAAKREDELKRIEVFSNGLESGAGKLISYGKSLEQIVPQLQSIDQASKVLDSSVARLQEVMQHLAHTQSALQHEIANSSRTQQTIAEVSQRSIQEIQNTTSNLQSSTQEVASGIGQLVHTMHRMDQMTNRLASMQSNRVGQSAVSFPLSYWISLGITLLITAFLGSMIYMLLDLVRSFFFGVS